MNVSNQHIVYPKLAIFYVNYSKVGMGGRIWMRLLVAYQVSIFSPIFNSVYSYHLHLQLQIRVAQKLSFGRYEVGES